MSMRGTRRPSVVPITAPSFPTPPRPHVYRKIAYTFIGFTVLIVLAVVWLSSVHAEVVVKVKRTPVALDAKVIVAKETSSGQIPGRVVQGVFEKIQEFTVQQASSTEPALTPPPAPPPGGGVTEVLVAKGTVRIFNKYSRSQTLVKTTRLLTTDNKLYRIDKQVVIPSGGEVSVGVYADQPGAEFAIGPSKFTIPGLWIDLQKFIYAESDAAFTAVPSKAPAPAPTPVPKPVKPAKNAGPVVSAADIEAAYKTLTDAVLGQAKKQLASELNDAKLSDATYAWKVTEKKSNVSAGQSAETFLASIKLEVTMVAYAKEDMIALVRSKVKEKIPDGREILPFKEDDVTYEVESADVGKESATVRITANAEYRLNAANPLLQKSIVAGKTKTEAEQILKAVEGVEDATVTIAPRWMSKIPALQDRIEMKIE